jgi:hypothetical protein
MSEDSIIIICFFSFAAIGIIGLVLIVIHGNKQQ